MKRSIFSEEHAAFRSSVRRFYQEHITPHRDRFEEQGFVDREVWRKAGELGFLCTTIPEEYGGAGVDRLYPAILIEEQGRAGDSGPGFWVHSDIAAPYILAYGTEAQKRAWLPRLASGEAILAVGMSEPGAGSDLQAIRTRAVRDGDEYVITGSKTFISNGWNADLIVLVCKTDPSAGARGISLILVETNRPGFRRGKLLKKLGLRAQDTAELYFDDLRVPASNLLGQEGEGFGYLMKQLAWERMQMAILALAVCEKSIEDTLGYTGERRVFGKAVADFQNTQFRLAELATETQVGRVFVDHCLELVVRDALDPVTAAMAKYWCTEMQGRVVDGCLQLYGGYGFMWDYPIARAYADARVQRIAGGTNEIMKQIIAKALPSIVSDFEA
ncbi:acyl-CoA dehydrogenase family protein [Vineibacter terrae]|uniref:acyl-CoA dehydrogenase family protein n=1 Tax=Vineibacter terrae TaxID=2586908 RepID=UPI002E37DA50|nr:acyl-CoA dehydrogenase family protein [Vineibacter terrae]HEX2885301.1 acyl-CoA dehydrogenase family protein [Vineibacter terrae]